MNRISGMTQQLARVAVPGQSQTYNQYAIPGQIQQPQTHNPYGQVQPVMAPNPYTAPAMAQPGFNSSVAPSPYVYASPYAPQPATQSNYGVPGMMQPTYNPYIASAPVQQQAYNPYMPAPTYNPYAPTAPMQPVANPYVVPQHPGMPTYNPYTTVQPQANYSQNGIPSESEHIYNFLYSSSKTKEEIVDYIKNQDPFYSSQENGDITIYSTNIGIYFVCNNTITNSNFLEAVLKSALIRNYRILDNGYVAFISEIAISYTESITRDSIINFAKYLCKKNYLLTLRKEQFIFTNSGNLIFIDFSNLIPKEYMMGLEKYLYSPSGEVLYQEPSILFNNVDCLFIDILGKKYFKRNEIIEIEKRITNFNQLKRSVCR
ncbi:MAG: hypothetical protein ACRC8M_13655 [Cetobacterium sp.]|uniref:hypothetical protein n=1 Tax=Cetobacterium sp. TaxID=2071632 RepID=UPI003F2C95DB